MAEHANLNDALLAIQRDLPPLQKTATNPHFQSRFVPLEELHKKVLPIINGHGCIWTTKPCHDGNGAPALKYKLTHASSGQSEGDTMPLLLTKTDPQGQGSAITYARRYALQAVLGIVGDEDDDGNAASPPATSSSPQHYAAGEPSGAAAYPLGPAPQNERISEGKARRAFALRKQHRWEDHEWARLLDRFEVHKADQLSFKAYDDFCAYIERKKQLPPETDVPADMDGLEPQPVSPYDDPPPF